MKKVINKKGYDYALDNFYISLLEHLPMNYDEKTVIERENHWKNVLLSRGDYGYNEN